MGVPIEVGTCVALAYGGDLRGTSRFSGLLDNVCVCVCVYVVSVCVCVYVCV